MRIPVSYGGKTLPEKHVQKTPAKNASPILIPPAGEIFWEGKKRVKRQAFLTITRNRTDSKKPTEKVSIMLIDIIAASLHF